MYKYKEHLLWILPFALLSYFVYRADSFFMKNLIQLGVFAYIYLSICKHKDLLSFIFVFIYIGLYIYLNMGIVLDITIINSFIILIVFSIFFYKNKTKELIKTQNRKLQKQNSIDYLTKLYNKKFFDKIVTDSLKKDDVSILLIDVDYFKKVNDTYGHLCGDYVLKEIAKILKKNIKDTDYAFRVGGEEFAIILSNHKDNDIKTAQKIKNVIQNKDFIYKNQAINTTISIGISHSIDADTKDEYIKNADKALYKAKNSGRNAIIVY